MKKTRIVLILVALVILTGCADVAIVDACLIPDPYGFFGGLWHGIISPISFFGSLFFNDIAMYAVNNNGEWYDFGFWLGMGGLGVSSRKIL